MLQEFKDFLLRGNLIELAVAFVLGTAFATVVKSLVDNLITPVIALIGGKPDFSGLSLKISDTDFRYGQFLTDLISFAIIAAVIFFVVVKPVNALLERVRRGEEQPQVEPEILLLEEIRDELRSQGAGTART
ncbi:MAG: large conductance mechanosensitive channel protein MscL [Thermoleophilaceae bacterium]